ncbi:cytochrome P450 [Saccharopolyspora phatthalungensis]|uniref:Cytochrome P450 n=1 Tax=Saccharopolyspora phatthalungensis TaxID=664693 RepID=A0A840QAM3_9PSEU|nr:cytochrome P450 [Saccharopolyspora phatthalungensis]MBB5157824.1 cytochrome P450 [Saccharopolyspora phatthalungensis]
MGGAHTAPDRRTHRWPVDDLDGLDFDPLLSRLLVEEPIARIRLRFGEGDAWLVTRHADVRAVAAESRFSRAATVDRPVTSMTPHVVGLPGGIGRTDPPDHNRLRRLLAQSFTPRRVAAIRPRTERIADELFRRMLAQGPPADLAGSFIGPLSTQVISELMGVPRADWPRMHHWRQILLSSNHSRAEADAVKAELRKYFTDLAEHLRSTPGDDAFSALVAAREASELSQAELISLAVILQLNGMDAVGNNSSNMIYALLTHPEQRARLRDESLVRQAVEELFRYVPHRNGVGLPRIAMDDIRIGDVTIATGEAVYVSYLAANRDPEFFTDPHRLDLGRGDNPHLAFGHGTHFCAGAALARMEAQVVISSLLRQFPRLRLACQPAEMSWRRGTINRGPESLPVTW